MQFSSKQISKEKISTIAIDEATIERFSNALRNQNHFPRKPKGFRFVVLQ